MPSIPASAIVSVTPSVINAGGTGLQLSGLILTASTRLPVGTVLSFGSLAAVQAYFSASSAEANAAQVYFAGFDGSSIKPAALLFSQYPTAAVAAYLRGGSVSGLTLSQLQALNGVLTITVNGTPITSATINLSAATSFSNAATLIQAGFTTPPFTVTFDSISGAFVFTSNTTGAASAITFATGTLSTPLALTQATGAILSQGAIAATPAAAMNAIVAQTQNFATFTTLFEPATADGLAFAAWVNGTTDRYMFVAWDTDVNAYSVSDTSSLAYQIGQAGYDGTYCLFAPDATKAVFTMSIGASLDFTRTNDRATYAFKTQTGLFADVTNQVIAENLIANGYNFYGAYATAAQGFVFMYPGQVSGKFLWADSYINQIQLNNAFQLALMEMLTATRSVPYNDFGYGLIETSLLDPIEDALNFGSIRAGVTLSNEQQAQVNAAAGIDCADTVQNRGWYLSILPAPPSIRSARQSPPCIFIYTDGQSIQQIALNSIEVQ